MYNDINISIPRTKGYFFNFLRVRCLQKRTLQESNKTVEKVLEGIMYKKNNKKMELIFNLSLIYVCW